MPVIAADVSSDLDAQKTYSGAAETPAVKLSGQLSDIGAYFDAANHIDPAIIVTIESFVSADGVTWKSNGSSTHPGIPLADRAGLQAGAWGHSFAYFLNNGGKVVNASPFVKAVVTISKGSLLTTIKAAAK